ncbi:MULTISPECIES: type II secretion system F family protein [Rothia]|uniref:Type II secretion system protein GspF domain-containing protein n=1 Tax=Rothia nasimurium TaxID=85336 RepID=A0A1Y1RNL4_9MICC|nr:MULTISPECIES: type II secretion system F family protein [Rothia]ORC16408.1 hypothetical protein A7979_03535 [Rothia nasimurium]
MGLLLTMSCLCLLGALGLLVFTRVRARAAAGQKREERVACPHSRPRTEPSHLSLAPALYLELAATMLDTGLSVPATLQRLGQLEAGRYESFLDGVVSALFTGASWKQAWGHAVPEELTELRDTLGLTLSTGAPSAQLVRALAARERRHRQRIHEKAAARLAVKLVVPLGACSLPSFICLGVVPVLIALLPAIF